MRIMNGRISARIVFAVALGSVLLTVASCVRETPGHCAFAEGNSTCEAAYEGTFCVFQGPGFLENAKLEYRNVSEAQRLGCYESLPMMLDGPDVDMKFYGCVPNGLTNDKGNLRSHLLMLAKETEYDLARFLGDHGGAPGGDISVCRPGSGTTTETSDSSTTITDTESSTTDGETGEGSTTGPMPCMGNGECTELEAPQCVNGECMPCSEGEDGDVACNRVDATTPLCVGGICVQCTDMAPEACTDKTPICDNLTNTCVPCTAHDQCSTGACELGQGQCFPEDCVIEVGGDIRADYTSIVDAVGAVADGAHCIIMVHQQGVPYFETIRIDGGKVIAMLAAPAETPVIVGPGGGEPGLRVTEAGTTLYVDRLNVSNNASGGGLYVNNGAYAWADRSRIASNAGGGVLVQDASLTLRNCFVGGNEEATVVDVRNSTSEILYSTLGAGLGVTTGLTCDAESSVSLRNSLVVSRSTDPEIACTAIAFEASRTVTEAPLKGTGNVALGDMSTMWFPDFNAGDFHLTDSAPMELATTARWSQGDPATDIDGTPRLTVDGTADYAGADVP